MKKTLFSFMVLAAAFAATSCQSDEEFAQQPTDKPMVINAVAEGIGTGTRATMAYKYDILWSKDDQIRVKGGDSKSATFTLQSGEGTTQGTFKCENSPFASGDEVEAFYPASLVKEGSLVWPAKQTTSTVVPMYCKKTLGGTGSENFSFASLGAVLQIVFNTKQDNVTLKSVTVKDGTNPLSGTFTVKDGKAAITATDKAGITLDLGEGKELGDGANYFNIAVPAGTYSNLSITFTATDNTVCTLKGSVTIDHNTVGRLTLTGTKFKAPPTTGTAKATINGEEVDVNWVQLWAGGPKFAEYNVGVTDGKAESYGGYYAWGGCEDKVDDHNTTNKGLGNLTGDDDTATKLWGENWRMPTLAELRALISNCDVQWTGSYNDSGIKGRIFTGKGAYSSNSVFLPAAGDCYNGKVYYQGDRGRYWSSGPNGNKACYLNFDSDDQGVNFSDRGDGYSVRAVVAE